MPRKVEKKAARATAKPRRRLAVVALGGNMLQRPEDAGDFSHHWRRARQAADALVELVREGAGLLVVHGNGPQVGDALRRAEAAAASLPQPPLDAAVAATAGEIGYLLAEALDAALRQIGARRPVAAVVTRVDVDRDDPAFARPSKPVGAFLDELEALRLRARDGVEVGEDAGRGWRRLVPSPAPRAVLEIEALRALLDAGCAVIAGGGGGVPVGSSGNDRRGLEAVIDKDRTAALLARELGADLLVILTGVDRVVKNFGRRSARALPALGLRAALRLQARGQFPTGSMGPKIEAAMDFVARAGRPALITSPEALSQALRGESGTFIVPDADWLRGGPWGL